MDQPVDRGDLAVSTVPLGYRSTCDRCGKQADHMGYERPAGWGVPYIADRPNLLGGLHCSECLDSLFAWLKSSRTKPVTP